MLPAGFAGRDVICCADKAAVQPLDIAPALLVPVFAGMFRCHSGTAACNRPHRGPCKPDVVVLSLLRWRCQDIHMTAIRLCHHTPFRILRLQSQEDSSAQVKELAVGADVLIATPGRLREFVAAGLVDLSAVNALAVDN